MLRNLVFDRWLIAGAAPAIEAALGSIGPAQRGPIAVAGDARLARALTRPGRAVTLTGAAPRDVRKAGPDVTLADDLGERTFAVVVGCGSGDRADWEAVIATWARAVVDGGGLVLVDRIPAIELSRRALCLGLSALEQRVSGRWIVTSGLVSDL